MKYSLASSSWGKEELGAIKKVMDNGRFTMGPMVQEFEKQFAKKFDAENAVMVNSGSSANLLMISLLRWKKKLTGNIIVPTVGWSTTYFPLPQNNFKPNFVDVDPDTFNIDTTKIESAINNETVAIMPVNLCGNPCDFAKLKDLCKKHDLYLIEDNCESMGALWNEEEYTGNVGNMGSFSFFFSHHIQTMEGGMVLCKDKDDADYLRSLRAHGWCRDFDNDKIYEKTGNFFKDSFTFVTPGYSIRPVEMSGAIGLEQLEKWDDIRETRIKNAQHFIDVFDNVPWMRYQKPKHGRSTWFSFGCVLQEKLAGVRHKVVEEFDKAGIESRPLASGNFMKQPVLKEFNYIDYFMSYPNSDDIDNNGFWVGNHAIDIKDNIEQMYDVLKKVADGQ